MMNTPPPETLGRIVRWLIMLFFAYALWHGSTGIFHSHPQEAASLAKSPQTSQSRANIVPTGDCSKQANPFTSFSGAAIPFLPEFTPALQVEDTKPGSGETAFCGQHATVHYSYSLRTGNLIYNNDSTSAQVQLGGNTVLPGLQQGLIGMKTGGERTISIPPKLAFGSAMDFTKLQGNATIASANFKSEIIIAKATLDALTPPAPASAMPLRILATTGYASATGGSACGDTVHAIITLWKLDGTRLFSTLDSHPLIYTLGSGTLPFGLEQGMLGMKPGMGRTLIIPPALTKPLYESKDTTGTPLGTIAWPANEIVLAEVELITPPAPSTH